MKMLYRTLPAILLLALLSGCATLIPPDYDDPEVEVVGLRPLPSSGLEARFELSLRVVNPNPVGLDLQGIYYELYVEGSKLLSGANSNSAIIPAYGETTLAIEASASMLGSFTLIQKLLNEPPENGIGYVLKAKLSVANWPMAIRIQREGRIGQQKTPAVSSYERGLVTQGRL